LDNHGQPKEKFLLPSVSFHTAQFLKAEFDKDKSFWKLVLMLRPKRQCFYWHSRVCYFQAHF